MESIEMREGAFPAKGNWTVEQTKLAFHFYCQTPFGKLHGRNPDVVALASLLHRTPDALAMKCCNIASLDPAMRARGVAGLGNASSMDQQVWDEFHADWEALELECERMLAALRTHANVEPPTGEVDADEIPEDFTGHTRLAMVEQRVKQRFFRRAVLSGYRGRCCITGLADSRLLVASHIVPWRSDISNRLNPSNGLCLSAIHDKAFDTGLISLSDDFRVLVSEDLLGRGDVFAEKIFGPIIGRKIELPERFLPDKAFIKWHRSECFKGD